MAEKPVRHKKELPAPSNSVGRLRPSGPVNPVLQLSNLFSRGQSRARFTGYSPRKFYRKPWRSQPYKRYNRYRPYRRYTRSYSRYRRRY